MSGKGGGRITYTPFSTHNVENSKELTEVCKNLMYIFFTKLKFSMNQCGTRFSKNVHQKFKEAKVKYQPKTLEVFGSTFSKTF